MGIYKFIKAKKEEIKQRSHLTRAGKLELMRKERIKEEARAKVSKLYEEEKDRIKKAKQESYNQSFTGRAIKKVKKLKKRSNKPKGRLLAKKEGGFSLGSGFGQGINPAFSLGKTKPKKKKPKTITIKIDK